MAFSSRKSKARPEPGAGADLARLARLSQAAVTGLPARELLGLYAEQIVEATGATRGFIALADAEIGGLSLVATAGEGWTEAARRDRLSARAEPGGDDNGDTGTITSRVATTGLPVRIGDITVEAPDYRPYFPGIRSVMAVPILLEPEVRVRGVINLECDRVGAFTPEHEAFVDALADLAALRLFTDDLHRREEVLVQIGKELSVAPNADTLMRRVVEIAGEVLRFEDCSLFILDKSSGRLVLVATRGPSLAAQVGRATYEVGEGLTGWVAQNGEPVRVRDPNTDPRHKGVHRELEDDEAGAFLAVPIRSLVGVVGVLRVLRRRSTSPWFPNDFTEADEEVLSTIASQIGAAIDNAQLFTRLLQSERMAAWGQMSAMSSHMIGNRVFAIKGDLNELEYRLGDGPDDEALSRLTRGQLAPLVAGMKRGIFRLEELLAEFRDFVRATALTTQPLELNDLTRSVIEETFPKRGNVELSVNYADGALPVEADPIKLRRAFAEIIENAVTFQEATGGMLRIETRRVPPNESMPQRLSLPRRSGGAAGANGYACVSFEDKGPGVPEENRDNIFRPFFTSRNRGMGLGLAIVKGIIEAHHGGIVEVGAPGGGAKFLIYLPLREQVTGDRG